MQVMLRVQDGAFLDALFEVDGKCKPMLAKLSAQISALIDSKELWHASHPPVALSDACFLP